MSLHEELTYTSERPYEVGSEKIREFARSVGSTHPLHADIEFARKAGFANIVAPPTFAIVLQERTMQAFLDDERVQIPLQNVVHADQAFEYSRPIVAGDALTATTSLASLRELGGNKMITLKTEVVDERGEHVVTSTTTLLARVGEGA